MPDRMNTLPRCLWPLERLARLAWWRWARRDLQHKNAADPGIPEIVLTIHRLEQS